MSIKEAISKTTAGMEYGKLKGRSGVGKLRCFNWRRLEGGVRLQPTLPHLNPKSSKVKYEAKEVKVQNG